MLSRPHRTLGRREAGQARYFALEAAIEFGAVMQSHARDAGLEFETVQTFGQSYAITLTEWRRPGKSSPCR